MINGNVFGNKTAVKGKYKRLPEVKNTLIIGDAGY